MKRIVLWISVLLAASVLNGCQTANVYTVTQNNEETYTVDRVRKTVACHGVVYQFKITRSDERSVDLDITYPDGSTYYWSQTDGLYRDGWSDDYDPLARGYVPGCMLRIILMKEVRPSGQMVAGPELRVAFLLLAVGALLAFVPWAAWMLAYGWRFEDAEPSDSALTATRILGVTLIVIGIICLLDSVDLLQPSSTHASSQNASSYLEQTVNIS